MEKNLKKNTHTHTHTHTHTRSLISVVSTMVNYLRVCVESPVMFLLSPTAWMVTLEPSWCVLSLFWGLFHCILPWGLRLAEGKFHGRMWSPLCETACKKSYTDSMIKDLQMLRSAWTMRNAGVGVLYLFLSGYRERLSSGAIVLMATWHFR